MRRARPAASRPPGAARPGRGRAARRAGGRGSRRPASSGSYGLVAAAWPAARLLGEPIFGWLADRVARRPLMIIGLVLASGFAVLPLFAVGPAAFVVCRALSGLASSMYDPAARGYLVDANPPE